MIKDIICFAKVRPEAKIPSKREEDVGYDIYSCFDEFDFIIKPHEVRLVSTGIASAYSDDWGIIFRERGSTAMKNVKINAGVIDSGFRNEWFIAIYNGNHKPIIITKTTDKEEIDRLEKDGYIVYLYSKAIAQAIIIPVPKVKIKEVSYDKILNIKSERKLGMLGSSGK
jgi:dUTP pyrophosphatase